MARDFQAGYIELLSQEDLASGKSTLENFMPLSNVKANPSEKIGNKVFFRLWDGVAEVDASKRFLKLDQRVQVQFCDDRKYRRSESWLVPYRGKKASNDLCDMLPTGRHYFAQVWPLAMPNPPQAESAAVVSANEGDHLDRLIDKLVGSTDSLRRSLPAKPLADETSDPWLKKWLGAALFSEVAHGGFEQFWRRLNQSRPSGGDDEGRFLDEAKRIWTKSQKLDLALKEASMTNRLQAMI